MARELFLFRYRDELTGKQVRARYAAERHVIAERDNEWEIIGASEVAAMGVRDFSPTALRRGLD